MELDFDLQVKSLTQDGEFRGLASTHGVDRLGDKVLPGAFAATLAKEGSTRPILWSHDQARPVGLGTLKESAVGLEISGKLALGVTAADEAYQLMKQNVVKGLSIGFGIPEGGAEFKDGVRLLKAVTLYEVSLVAVPANPGAQIQFVKSGIGSLRDFESFLHRSGWSRSEARKLAAKGWDALSVVDDSEAELLTWLREANGN